MTVSTLAPPLVVRTGRRGRLHQLVKRMHSSAAIWPWVIPSLPRCSVLHAAPGWIRTPRGLRFAVHPWFGHLQRRTFTMLLSLDPVAGTGQVLTNHDGVVTLYIKCPGMDMMALTCELLSEVSPRDSWPICSRVDEIRNQIEDVRC